MDQNKITALYCRFAYGDSEEIMEEQKNEIAEFAKANGYENCKFYIDNGVSGLVMDRPAFNELMKDIENGLVATVIASDEKRICRRQSVSEQYIEEIFPSFGVTFVAANDKEKGSLMDILLSGR